MGQGTLTGIAQLVAEELECDWNKVATEGITPGRNLASKRAWGEMGTGGAAGYGTSEDYGSARRRCSTFDAASSRRRPMECPGRRADCIRWRRTHGVSKRSIRYGEVAAAAAKLTPPDPKAIKSQGSKRLEDRRQGRSSGSTTAGQTRRQQRSLAIDLKHARHASTRQIKDCPVFGGKLTSYDESKNRWHARCEEVVRVQDTAVAVVADTWWHAKKASKRSRIGLG